MVEALLRELIACPSVTPYDAGCQEIVASRLEAAGFAVEFLQFGEVSNLWATHGSGGPLVCLAGHTDVVPPGPREAWSSDPFTATVSNGQLIGRGAADMKGSDAAMVIALESLARHGHVGTIALLLTSDEEGPGVDGTKRTLQTLVARGIKIDAAILGEPTSEKIFGDTIKSGRRGSMSGRLTVRGIQGHTAYPQLADNAAHKLAEPLRALVTAEWGNGTDDFPPTTLQVSKLTSGGEAGNVIPGLAEVRFNLRFGPDWTVDALQSRIVELIQATGVEPELAWGVSALPFLTEPGALLGALTTAIESVTGVQATRSTGGGTSDARFFAAHGIPVAEFGPLNATIHAADEQIELACLEPLAEIYRRTVEAICSQSFK